MILIVENRGSRLGGFDGRGSAAGMGRLRPPTRRLRLGERGIPANFYERRGRAVFSSARRPFLQLKSPIGDFNCREQGMMTRGF